jgi:hypothetical protein
VPHALPALPAANVSESRCPSGQISWPIRAPDIAQSLLALDVGVQTNRKRSFFEDIVFTVFSSVDLPVGLIFRNPVKSSPQKRFLFIRNSNQFYISAVPARIRVAIAIVTNVGCGMRWTCLRR